MSSLIRAIKTLGTHAGTFHCDESLACYLLVRSLSMSVFSGTLLTEYLGFDAMLPFQTVLSFVIRRRGMTGWSFRTPFCLLFHWSLVFTAFAAAASSSFLLAQTRLEEFKDAKIIRSRDEEVLSKIDCLVDVGNLYDHEKLRFVRLP